MIEFQNVTKKYPNGTVALNDVSLRINDGEFVFIVGSSGAGKSTLIKLMLREETANSGVVKVNGKNLGKMARYKIPKFRRSIGIVFQDFRLIPNMSAYDNVAFALRVTNVPSKEIKRKVPYMLNLVGLSSKMKCKPEELSGGEQQMLAMGRALMSKPKIILMDEPSMGLSPIFVNEIFNIIQEVSASGTTVLLVEQNAKKALSIADRAYVLETGNIALEGDAKILMNDDSIKKAYLGE